MDIKSNCNYISNINTIFIDNVLYTFSIDIHNEDITINPHYIHNTNTMFYFELIFNIVSEILEFNNIIHVNIEIY